MTPLIFIQCSQQTNNIINAFQKLAPYAHSVFIYLFIYYFAEEHSIYYYNNSDSWLIMLMQPDLEGHELLH